MKTKLLLLTLTLLIINCSSLNKRTVSNSKTDSNVKNKEIEFPEINLPILKKEWIPTHRIPGNKIEEGHYIFSIEQAADWKQN